MLDCTDGTVASGVILDMAAAARLQLRATDLVTIDGTLTGDGHRNRPNRCPRPDDRLDSSRGAWVTDIPTRIPCALNGYDPTGSTATPAVPA